jgi:fatty acid synthase
MAADLLDDNQIFSQRIKECAAVLDRHYSFDLLSQFKHVSGWCGATEASVGLTALQIGLVDILDQEFGIKPAGFLGHSAGTWAFPHILSSNGFCHGLCLGQN